MDMFERFTDRARKVMALANQEAQRLNHEYIGTEHILLGLVKEGSGVGANVLRNLEVDLNLLGAGNESGEAGESIAGGSAPAAGSGGSSSGGTSAAAKGKSKTPA